MRHKPLDETAQELGVPRRTLQRWLAAGKLTPYAIEGDRRRYVDLAEVERLREPKALQQDFMSLAADWRRFLEEQAAYCRAVAEGTESAVGRRRRSSELRLRRAELIRRTESLAPADDANEPSVPSAP